MAQIFADKGPDDPRRQLAANDTYFTDSIFLYTENHYIPYNKKEGFVKARFNDRSQIDISDPQEIIERPLFDPTTMMAAPPK